MIPLWPKWIPLSLEEGFAGEQLKEQLEVLSDETALSHPVMAPYIKRIMPKFLTRHMDPYPFLPTPSTADMPCRTHQSLPPVS